MVVTLSVSAFVLALQTLDGRVMVPSRLYWPLFGLVGLADLQLLPIPPALHAVLAPGSHALWHPTERAAAAILGTGWRPVSVHPQATIEWMAWVMGLLMLSSLAAPALHRRSAAVRAAVAVIGGGLIVAVYGIVARTLFGPLLFGRIAVPTVSPFGPFVSKNHFAGYVEMVALLAMGWAIGLMEEARKGKGVLSWVGSARAGRIVAALGLAAALALAIPVSQSRGGVLSLVAGLVAFFVLAHRGDQGTLPRRRWVTAAIGVGVLIAIAQAVLPPEAAQRVATLASSAPDTSASYRLGLWRDTLRAAAASPIPGQGLGAFQDALPRFKQSAGDLRVEHAENDYLELLVEGGVIAALALAAFLWLLLTTVGKCSAHRGVELGLRFGTAAAGVALGVHSLVDFNLHLPACASLACFLLTLVSREVESRFLEGILARAVGAAGLLAVALVAASMLSGSALTADPPLLTGRGLHGLRGKHNELLLRASVQERPAEAEGWASLAWLRYSAGAQADGASLAFYAAQLDPTRDGLRSLAERLSRREAPH